jgi:putative membrane protein
MYIPLLIFSIGLILFIGLTILIVLVVKKLTEKSGSTSKHDPLDTAKERYARGEITEEEFNRIKQNLS